MPATISFGLPGEVGCSRWQDAKPIAATTTIQNDGGATIILAPIYDPVKYASNGWKLVRDK